VALGGTSAYAANTVLSADIVDDAASEGAETLTLALGSAATGRVIDNHLTGADIAPNSLKGEDIDESSLALDFQGTAKAATRRSTLPVYSGQLVLDVPGFGEVRQASCNSKTAKSRFFNDTSKTIDVFTDESGFTNGVDGPTSSTDPEFHELAPKSGHDRR
jgi:hypothetical protein